MSDTWAKKWSSVCELTNAAMDALLEVEQTLMAADADRLTPVEFRTLLWVRCSLASLYGVRADETMIGAESLAHLFPALSGDWVDELVQD